MAEPRTHSHLTIACTHFRLRSSSDERTYLVAILCSIEEVLEALESTVERMLYCADCSSQDGSADEWLSL